VHCAHTLMLKPQVGNLISSWPIQCARISRPRTVGQDYFWKLSLCGRAPFTESHIFEGFQARRGLRLTLLSLRMEIKTSGCSHRVARRRCLEVRRSGNIVVH
jgi:hypothetical protein